MADSDKDDLARMLGEMADGHVDHSRDENPPEAEPAPAAGNEPAEHRAAPTAPIIPHAPGGAGVSPRRVPPAVPPSLVHSLGFKRTIIPVLLTIGFLCPALCVVGGLSGADSGLAAFARMWFVLPALLIGAAFLALAALTMLQVRNELQRRRAAMAPGARPADAR